jgi:hypothetical protein
MSTIPRVRSASVVLLAFVASVTLAGAGASCGSSDHPAASADAGDDTSPTSETTPGDAGDPCAADVSGVSGTSALSAVWANEGGDKVMRHEVRASGHPDAVKNRTWDGGCVQIFGAENEVVSFDLVLEAASTKAAKVSVSLSDLTGPGGAVIRSRSRASDKLFDWTSTEAELFFVRYLQIKGLSQQAYGTLESWQEATFPTSARCPGMTQANPDSKPTGAGCAWSQRPVADKFVPDIAVPLELVPTFEVAAPGNQSIWADVYIPKSAPAGVYGGMVTISENGAATHKVPVRLRVRGFALPDAPSAKTMLVTSYGDIAPRYAKPWPNPGTPDDVKVQTALKNQRLVAHRHKITLIGDDENQTGTKPGADYVPVLDGSFFSAANGYAGPGVGKGFDVYSIGTYGSLTGGSTQAAFAAAFTGWGTWFEANLPNVERFVYLCDESACQGTTPTLTTQLQWWSAIGGAGSRLHTLATQELLDAPAKLSVPTSSWPFSRGVTTSSGASTGGTTAADQQAVDAVLAQEPNRRLYAYNGQRPGAGSCAIEDDGTALREQPWGQYKKRIDRWFWWEATYYDDFQAGLGKVDLFTSANTFGTTSHDAAYGEAGGANGNGVFFYPGTDTLFPTSSYGLSGPIASLRLKHWRRGLQDVDYLVLAAAKDPVKVQQIVDRIVPKVLWEVQCHDPVADCSYSYAPVSWSADPDVWEAARAELASILDGG